MKKRVVFIGLAVLVIVGLFTLSLLIANKGGEINDLEGNDTSTGKQDVSTNQDNDVEIKYRTVELFYYDTNKDNCNDPEYRKGLTAVERQIQDSGDIENDIKNTINLWLDAELTSDEKDRGIITELNPDGSIELVDLILDENGVLSVTLSDPKYETVGGSCHAGVLYSEFIATLEQFPEVKSIRISPKEGLFEA